MKKLLFIAVLFGFSFSLISCSSKFKLESPAFKNKADIPYTYTYCQPNGEGGIKAGGDMSPALMWSSPPEGTQSYALLVTDPFFPDSPYLNVSGHVLTKSTSRVTGYHWVLVNIPAQLTSLPEGAGSKGIVPGGKKTGITPYGLAGINVYTGVFKFPAMAKMLGLVKTNASWKGTYGQYDGGCPPWNDKVIHYYKFKLYALDVADLNLPANGNFTGVQALAAMQGHILATATLHGRIQTNPDLLAHDVYP